MVLPGPCRTARNSPSPPNMRVLEPAHEADVVLTVPSSNATMQPVSTFSVCPGCTLELDEVAARRG